MYDFPNYWTNKLKVDFLQRVILINSYLYYEKNITKMSDKHFDEIAKQLVSIQKNMSIKKLKETMYGYVFYDFDGTTGFDLFSRLKRKDKEYIVTLANMLLKGE